MNGYFGRRNAWADGPPPGGGNFDPTVGGPRGNEGGGGGAANLSEAVRRARTEARAIVYQRKKKEENRSIFQETLKRDFIKEKNYLIFQLREGEDRCSYDAIGEVLDNLGLTASDVVSIAENPYNEREIEVLMKEETEFEIAELSRKLDAMEAPVTVNKMGKLEEVFIIRNLPLTLDQTTVRNWIKDAVAPFVEQIHDITPLKHSRKKINEVGAKASKFFEGKYDGNWRVAVTPKGAAEVPSFAVFGPQNLQGAVKYSKRGQPVNELCWSCYAPGHKRSDKNQEGKFICPGPKEWMTYVIDFQEKAAEISGKSAEELYSFTDGGLLHRRMERQLVELADSLEKEKNEKDAKERALKETQEAVKLQIEENNEKWRKVISEREKEFNESLESSKKAHLDEAFNKMKEEMEIMKVRLEETENRNKDLKKDNLDLKKQNEDLNGKSVEDSLEMADISQKNDELIKMLTKGSTLDEISNSSEVPAVLVDGKLEDDPMMTHDEVFEDGGEKDVMVVSKKHGLSPQSVDSGLPMEKHLVRRKSVEKSVIVRPDQEPMTPSLMPPPALPSPALPPPPLPPPPPTPHKRSPVPKSSDDLSFPSPPPKPGRKSVSPIIRPISKGYIIEISCENGGSVTGKVKECQVKKSSKDYQKYKNFWNVEIIKGNDLYKEGESFGFDLKNPKSYKIITVQPTQQPLAVGSREVNVKLN